MSMLSSQVEEMRRMADGQATYRDARAVMLQAADTIAELRGALSVASVDYRHLSEENAKLREMCKDMMVAWWACDKERCPRHDKRCEEGKFCAFDECARDLGIEVDE